MSKEDILGIYHGKGVLEILKREDIRGIYHGKGVLEILKRENSPGIIWRKIFNKYRVL